MSFQRLRMRSRSLQFLKLAAFPFHVPRQRGMAGQVVGPVSRPATAALLTQSACKKLQDALPPV